MHHPSSTSSSEPRSLSLVGLRPTGVLFALLFLLAFELLVARSDWFWIWPERSESGALHVLERRVIPRHPDPRVVVVGSSRLRDAVVPSVLAAEFGLPRESVVNLSVTGGSSLDARELLERNPAWFARADVLIVGIEDWYFLDAFGPSERERRFATSAENAAAWEHRGGAARALLEDHVKSFVAARRLGAVARAGARPVFRPMRLDAEDRLTWRRSKAAVGAEAVPVGAAVARYYGEDRVGSFRESALRGLVEGAQAAGLRVVLVQVPWREEYVDAVERAHDVAWRSYHEQAQQLATSCGVLLVAEDRGSAIGLARTEFVDYGHLTDTGGAEYSAWLAGRLRAAGVLPPHRER